MAEIDCLKCGERFEPAGACPACGEIIQPHQRLAALQAALKEAEGELERLNTKGSPFARAKSGALKSKIKVLKLQIEKLPGDRQ